MTSGSDDDYVVLVHGAELADVRPSVEAVKGWLEQDPAGTRAQGREDVFGEPVFSGDLIDNVGLDRDSNRNLIRRSPVMLESLARAGEEALVAARRSIIDSYLSDTTKAFHLPRFLLNDIVR